MLLPVCMYECVSFSHTRQGNRGLGKKHVGGWRGKKRRRKGWRRVYQKFYLLPASSIWQTQRHRQTHNKTHTHFLRTQETQTHIQSESVLSTHAKKKNSPPFGSVSCAATSFDVCFTKFSPDGEQHTFSTGLRREKKRCRERGICVNVGKIHNKMKDQKSSTGEEAETGRG